MEIEDFQETLLVHPLVLGRHGDLANGLRPAFPETAREAHCGIVGWHKALDAWGDGLIGHGAINL